MRTPSLWRHLPERDETDVHRLLRHTELPRQLCTVDYTTVYYLSDPGRWHQPRGGETVASTVLPRLVPSVSSAIQDAAVNVVDDVLQLMSDGEALPTVGPGQVDDDAPLAGVPARSAGNTQPGHPEDLKARQCGKYTIRDARLSETEQLPSEIGLLFG